MHRYKKKYALSLSAGIGGQNFLVNIYSLVDMVGYA